MNPNVDEWDDDLPPEPEEVYQDLVRALKRKSGFGLFFVQCTSVEADKLIAKLPHDIPQKNLEVLRLFEPIDKLYQRVDKFVKDKKIDILLITGLEYSLYKYEKRTFGEITEGKFRNLTSVPHILNHLNQQRERFRDDFPFCFVFLLRSFSIDYFIHRAPDFFDWRSGLFELPTTPELLQEQSTRLIVSRDYEQYLKLSQEQKIEKVLEFQDLLAEKHQTEGRKVSLLYTLGNVLYTVKEYEAAIAFYDKVLEIQPDKDEAWNNQGIALDDLGVHEKVSAFALLNKVIEILEFRPDSSQVWNNRGIALVELGRYEQAIASYDKALEIQPNDHYAWNGRGYALLNLGRYEEAIASYDKALEIKPDDDQAWNQRGYALVYLGRYEEAIASYDKALEIKPDQDEAWNGRGYALVNLGRYEEAIAAYDQTINIQPDYHLAWYNKACCYALQGNIEQALENLQQAINLSPKEVREMAKTDFGCDSIRKDERFQALIQ